MAAGRRGWGQGDGHTRKSVWKGGGSGGARLPVAQSLSGGTSRKPFSLASGGAAVAAASASAICVRAKPPQRPPPPRSAVLSALSTCVPLRPPGFRPRLRPTCCEAAAAARVSEGWFGRGGGSVCWRRRRRGFGRCRARADPVSARSRSEAGVPGPCLYSGTVGGRLRRQHPPPSTP